MKMWQCPCCRSQFDEAPPGHSSTGLSQCPKCYAFCEIKPNYLRSITNSIYAPRIVSHRSLRSIFVRDNGICYLCNQRVEWNATGDHAPTRDHIRPKSRKGSDNARNLRLAHAKCNQDRGTMDLDIWFSAKSKIKL